MLLRMTHPKHGAMHVYTEAEALQHEKWGWVREKPAEEKKPEPIKVKRSYVRRTK